ncbi:MAG: hypothetical protein M3Q48_09400 [Actinomycetota bacterium]|nr:hypothetical protein [Actinomycetota bacterium]
MSGTTTLTTVEVEEVVGRIGADLAATAGVQMIHLGHRAVEGDGSGRATHGLRGGDPMGGRRPYAGHG